MGTKDAPYLTSRSQVVPFSMKMMSIRTFISKLHNTLYLTIIGPLLLFGFLYLQSDGGHVKPPERNESMFIHVVMLIFFVDFFAANWLFGRTLREIRGHTDLGVRMKNYGKATRLRFFMISTGCLLLAIGFYLTGHPLYLVMFLLVLVLMSFWWPTPTKVSKDLLLKKEEREAVMKQTDIPVT